PATRSSLTECPSLLDGGNANVGTIGTSIGLPTSAAGNTRSSGSTVAGGAASAEPPTATSANATWHVFMPREYPALRRFQVQRASYGLKRTSIEAVHPARPQRMNATFDRETGRSTRDPGILSIVRNARPRGVRQLPIERLSLACAVHSAAPMTTRRLVLIGGNALACATAYAQPPPEPAPPPAPAPAPAPAPVPAPSPAAPATRPAP